ncbi:MAG: hypothetical protein ACR2M1_10490 [Gemmatimonadaceae bacterium]
MGISGLFAFTGESEMPETYTTRGTIVGLRVANQLDVVTPGALLGSASALDDSAALMAIATQRATDASIFDKHPPAFFEVIASTSALDAYSTIMADSTLQNFADNAAAGVNVLDSHNSYALGFGRSLTGMFEDTGNEHQMRSSFFTLSNWTTSAGSNADDYIAGIKSGIYSDISVGFSIPPVTGRMNCSICGGNMLDFETCPHFAGMTYTDQNSGNKIVAIGTIEGAVLNEYSPVYDGATPGAAVSKALRMAAAGMVDPAMADRLSTTYHRSIVVPRSWSGATVLGSDRQVQKGEDDMTLKESVIERMKTHNITVRNSATDEELITSLDNGLAGLIADLEAATSGAATAATALQNKIETLKAEKTVLEGDAEDGRAYRETVVNDAIESLVRTLPETSRGAFNRETQRTFMKRMALADVKALKTGWDAASQFQSGTGSRQDGTPGPVTPARKHRGMRQTID